MLQHLRYGAMGAAMTAALVVASAPASSQAPPSGAPRTKAPASRPTIVLVHGAFADGSSWDRVTPILQAKGYKVVAVHQPLLSVFDDVSAVKRAIEAQTGDVILVGHSYGGRVITEAGTGDKVIGLVYVAAFAPDAGESIADLGKGKPVPAWQQRLQVDASGFATLPMESVLKDFAQDLPATEAKVIAAKQGPLGVKTFEVKTSVAAWKTKPSWYVRATKDRIIDPAGQAMMAKRMNATTRTIDASHVVMLSKPQQVAAVILEAAAGSSETASR